MSKPYYYDELTNRLEDLELEITCNRFGHLVIKCLSEDQNEVQGICEELMHQDDYHIETC